MKPVVSLLAAAIALDGALVPFTRSDWFIFVAQPYVFAQAFGLAHWSGTTRCPTILPLSFTLAYLAILAFLLSGAPPNVLGTHVEYTPAINALMGFPLWIMLVTAPAIYICRAVAKDRFSLRYLLMLHVVVAIIAIEMFAIPYYDTTLGATIWRLSENVTRDPFTRFQLLLPTLYFIVGWCCIAAMKKINSTIKTVPVLIGVAGATALLHLAAISQWFDTTMSLLGLGYYLKITAGYGIAAVVTLTYLWFVRDGAAEQTDEPER